MKRLHAATAWLCCAVTALVAVVVLFAYGTTSFYLKGYTGEFPLSNPLLLLMAAAAFALLLVPVWRLRKGIAALGWRLPLTLSALLFAAQVFITYHAYFFSVWDARYVLEGARAFAYDMPEAISVDYFSMYPNNLTLAGIYGGLLRLPMCLGAELGEERGLLLLILVQCALNTACGLLLWSLTRRVAEAFSDGVTAAQAALVALIAYAVLIGLSPWFLVPYSDSSALIFPVLLLWLYERLRGRLPSALLLGALGTLAFMIKPQASIPLIAIALCELAALIVRRSKRSAVFLILMGSAFLLVVLPAQSVMERQIGIELDSDRAMNPAHYVNMGLNAEHDGAFNMPDLDAVLAVPAKERTAWCLRTAWARVKEYGVPGMAEHLLRKALVNFADGGFAWGIDFARNDLPVKDERLTPWVRSVVYSDGTRYPALHALEQAVWLLLLVLCPFGAFGLRRLRAEQETPVPAAMLLSVIGIIAFNMLFEAKARYVFVMVPVMIAVSAAGLCALRGRKRGG